MCEKGWIAQQEVSPEVYTMGGGVSKFTVNMLCGGQKVMCSVTLVLKKVLYNTLY